MGDVMHCFRWLVVGLFLGLGCHPVNTEDPSWFRLGAPEAVAVYSTPPEVGFFRLLTEMGGRLLHCER